MDMKSQALVLSIFLYLFVTIDGIPDVVPYRLKNCSKCPPGWGVAQQCTEKANTVCQRCTAGKTYSSLHSSKSPCWSCSKCGIGLYEAHRCTPLRDTVCDECLSYIDRKNFTELNDFKDKCSYIFLEGNVYKLRRQELH